MLHITKEMFKVNAPQPIAQGEVTIWREEFAPPEILDQARAGKLKVMALENDRLIVGHSETGHHHVIEAVREGVHVSDIAQALIDDTNDLFITLRLSDDAKVTHLRGTDTHTQYMLSAGNYIIRPDDEQTVEGWQRVAD